MIIVCNVVGDRCDLRFQAWPAAKLQFKAVIGLAQRPMRLPNRTIVLGQPLKRFPAEVKSVERWIGVLKLGDEAQRVPIMIEATGLRQ